MLFYEFIYVFYNHEPYIDEQNFPHKYNILKFSNKQFAK